MRFSLSLQVNPRDDTDAWVPRQLPNVCSIKYLLGNSQLWQKRLSRFSAQSVNAFDLRQMSENIFSLLGEIFKFPRATHFSLRSFSLSWLHRVPLRFYVKLAHENKVCTWFSRSPFICKRKAHRRVLHRSCVFTYRFAFMKHRIYFYYASINKQMMQWRRPMWSLALHASARVETRHCAPLASGPCLIFCSRIAIKYYLRIQFFLLFRWKYIWCEKAIRSSAFYRHRPPTRRLVSGRNM